MNRHQFLEYDLSITVAISPAQKRKLLDYLNLSSVVFKHFKEMGRLPPNTKKLQVSILICGDKKIQTLNTQFRNKNKVTDVLSFPAHDDLRNEMNRQSSEEVLFLGDLAICFPQAKRQAKKFKIGLWDEFIHLVFHGILHLLGYDHEVSEAEERLMQELEDWCVESFSKKKGAKSSL